MTLKMGQIYKIKKLNYLVKKLKMILLKIQLFIKIKLKILKPLIIISRMNTKL